MNPMILYDNRFLDGIPMATDTSAGIFRLERRGFKDLHLLAGGRAGV